MLFGITKETTFKKYYENLASIILNIHNIFSLKELQEMPIYKKKLLLKSIYKKYDKEESEYLRFKKLVEFLSSGFEALLKKPGLF